MNMNDRCFKLHHIDIITLLSLVRFDFWLMGLGVQFVRQAY
jgi:hypothetical protein